MAALKLRQARPAKPIHPTSWDKVSKNGLYACLAFLAIDFILAAWGHPQAATALGFFSGTVLGMSVLASFVATAARRGRLVNYDELTVKPAESRRSDPLMQHDEAVSPVVGVILMVAITVILAVVVFVLVGHLTSQTPNSNPNASFDVTKTTTTTASFQLVSQTSSWSWGSCVIKDGTGATDAFTVNAAGPTAAQSAAGDVVAVTGLTTKTPYDFLLVCAGQTVSHFSATTL